MIIYIAGKYTGKNKNWSLTDEEYIITYNYIKPNGFWVISAHEPIIIKNVQPHRLKYNHKKAEKLFLQKNPKAIVTCVTYV